MASRQCVISTHAPLAGRDRGGQVADVAVNISTHAPLAGRDARPMAATTASTDFNPRAPCGARRALPLQGRGTRYFNPRAPCGARRIEGGAGSNFLSYFNPRAPCGARRHIRGHSRYIPQISTHAPLAGRDVIPNQTGLINKEFQPTRPLRGATARARENEPEQRDFNPRAPCGARPFCGRMAIAWSYFNPRAPCGARPGKESPTDKPGDFNPRAPCGARRQ